MAMVPNNQGLYPPEEAAVRLFEEVFAVDTLGQVDLPEELEFFEDYDEYLKERQDRQACDEHRWPPELDEEAQCEVCFRRFGDWSM
jgi:hypothetical protein